MDASQALGELLHAITEHYRTNIGEIEQAGRDAERTVLAGVGLDPYLTCI